MALRRPPASESDKVSSECAIARPEQAVAARRIVSKPLATLVY